MKFNPNTTTPKDLADMSYGTFMEVCDLCVGQMKTIPVMITRELMRRQRIDAARLAEHELLVQQNIVREAGTTISDELSDSIFKTIFEDELCRSSSRSNLQKVINNSHHAHVCAIETLRGLR